MFENFPLWPAGASSNAGNVDALFIFLLVVCGLVTVAIFIMILVFAAKYRRRMGHEAEQIEGSTALEVTWSVIPLVVFMVIFVWGAVIYFQERTPPQGATEVYVVAKQWMWKLQHEGGQREINELHVPVGRDVKMIMTSQDVIHSFYVPAFRIKQDVLPGRYTTAWFHATKPGTYHLFCAEYCGTQHSGMIGQVVVMEPVQYQSWLSGGSASGSLAQNGQMLFQQLGCTTCHRQDTQGRGPNLVGLYGKRVTLEDGRTVVADENYIRESILNPAAKVVSGFKPIMPTFQGLVSEEQLLQLIEYVKSLNDHRDALVHHQGAHARADRRRVPARSGSRSGSRSTPSSPQAIRVAAEPRLVQRRRRPGVLHQPAAVPEPALLVEPQPALLAKLLLVVGFGIRSDVDDVRSVIIEEKLRDGEDYFVPALLARGREPREHPQALPDARVLIGAPRPHRPDQQLQVVDRANEGALKLGLPRGRTPGDARRDSLDRHRYLHDPARFCHRRAAAQTARGSGELGGVGRLHAFFRGQRLETREILTRLERKEIQQPARHRHQCVLQIFRKVGRLWLTVKTRPIMTTEHRAWLRAFLSQPGPGR